MKTEMKKISAIVIAFVMAGLAVTTSAHASGVPDKTGVEFTLISNIQHQPLFMVSLNNKEAAEYTIRISDAYGNQLYSGKVSGTNITRKFLVTTDDIPVESLIVEISSSKTKKEVYEILNCPRPVDDLLVNKLK